MPERRAPSLENSELREDRGIFKSGVVEVHLTITPLRRRTSRGDMLCIGFLDNVEIDIIFPGRRSVQCNALMSYLDKLVRKANQTAVKEQRPMPTPIHIRHPLRTEGTWRVRTSGDGDVPERRYQFVAARWRLRDQHGERVFGDLPVN